MSERVQAIAQVGEVELIHRIRRRIQGNASVAVGIGDDAAVLRTPHRGRLLFASDMLIEGVHFHRRSVPARQIGWKALACNVSDVAAMGGRPLWAVISLGLPPRTSVPFVDALYAGLERCARRFGVAIVGGDTVRAKQVVVDVAIIGTVEPERVVLRSGAQPGDALFVTGRLGGSYRSGRHARFLPRLAEAQALARRVRVHAMIDLSDGLASDLWQVSRASGMSLRVDIARIPLSNAARKCLRRRCPCRAWRGWQAQFHALMDGEDFELLFAVGAGAATRIPHRVRSCPVTRIGRVMARGIGVELEWPTGRVCELVPSGFRHF
ncbi:MAG: thiamine-phosphate kinase [Candidatus Omnitrophica bacterium]|nr:thiamine-phosphate kinase [Candidatus Omnitrophota bacterium]